MHLIVGLESCCALDLIISLNTASMEATTSERESSSLELALIDLYLNVKVRTSEEIADYDEHKMLDERESLKGSNLLLLVEYIKSSVSILMNMQAEERALANTKDEGNESMASGVSGRNTPKVYEHALQKMEAESRQHIRVQ